MARIPSANDLQTVLPRAAEVDRWSGSQMAAVASAYEGQAKIGQAIAHAGQAIAKIGASFEDRQSKQDRYEADKALLDFDLESDARQREHEKNMKPGASGFSTGVYEDYDTRAREHMKNVPESQKQYVDEQLMRRHERVTLASREMEERERDRFEVEGLDTRATAVLDAVRADPSLRDEQSQRLSSLVENSPISLREKAKRLTGPKSYQAQITSAAIEGELERLVPADPTKPMDRDAVEEFRKKVLRGKPEIIEQTEAGTGSGSGPRFSRAVEENIGKAALDADLPESTLRAFIAIESSGDPSARTGSYKGLLQLSDGEFRKAGGTGDIYDIRSNLAAGAIKLRRESDAFAKKYGRQPSAAELYMVHQQGEGGYAAHASNPDQPAWRSMYSTGEGQDKGVAWAKKAIWGNIPDADKRKFGSVENVTSAEFLALWEGKINRKIGVAPGKPAQVAETAPVSKVDVQPLQEDAKPPSVLDEFRASTRRDLAAAPKTETLGNILTGSELEQLQKKHPELKDETTIEDAGKALGGFTYDAEKISTTDTEDYAGITHEQRRKWSRVIDDRVNKHNAGTRENLKNRFRDEAARARDTGAEADPDLRREAKSILTPSQIAAYDVETKAARIEHDVRDGMVDMPIAQRRERVAEFLKEDSKDQPGVFAAKQKLAQRLRKELDQVSEDMDKDPAGVAAKAPSVATAESAAIDAAQRKEPESHKGVAEALVAQQLKIGINPTSVRLITLEQAKKRMGHTDGMDDKELRAHYVSVADSIATDYGPDLAERVFRDAFALTRQSKAQNEQAGAAIGQLAKSGKLSKNTAAKDRMLENADRALLGKPPLAADEPATQKASPAIEKERKSYVAKKLEQAGNDPVKIERLRSTLRSSGIDPDQYIPKAKK